MYVSSPFPVFLSLSDTLPIKVCTQKCRFMGKEVRENRAFCCAAARVSPLPPARLTHILIQKYLSVDLNFVTKRPHALRTRKWPQRPPSYWSFTARPHILYRSRSLTNSKTRIVAYEDSGSECFENTNFSPGLEKRITPLAGWPHKT